MPSSPRERPAAAARFLSRSPDTCSLDAIFPDLSGVIRGKRYPIAELGTVIESGFAIPGSVFMLDTMGESHDPDGIGFSDGDPDYQAKVIPGTLMPVPWAQRPLAQVMVTLIDDDGEPYYYEPRHVLRRAGQPPYDPIGRAACRERALKYG